jgi:putative transposase
LRKLGIDIGETRVSKYMVRCRKPPSQTWRTFLENHAQQLVSIDFFTVPTLRFHLLYVFLVMAHDRRRILYCNVTAHPTAEWTGQQLREAFLFDQLPSYLLRDRDAIFGDSREPRSIQPEHAGRVVALPQVGGLHHRYERRAA